MKVLKEISQVIDAMAYSAAGIGCGLEDAGITDRYEAAAYGFEEARKEIREIIDSYSNSKEILCLRAEEKIIRKFADILIAILHRDSDLAKPELDYDCDVIEQAIEEYKENNQPVESAEWKKMCEGWNERMKEMCPEADDTVLQFITDFTCHSASSEAEYEIIRHTFRAGYCWHFAHILKDTFKRGEVCWTAPFGHFVWVDDNGVPYDVEGVNFGEQAYNIPESYLGDKIRDFTHIPGETIPETTDKEVYEIIRKYEDDNQLPHKAVTITLI